jgi:hypothetical protein
MDEEPSPSEESDSEATVLPKGGSWEGKSPVGEHEVGDEIDGMPVIAELDLERQLDPNLAWISIGLDRRNGTVHLHILGKDWPSPFEFKGFVDTVVNPDFVMSNIKQGGDNGQ